LVSKPTLTARKHAEHLRAAACILPRLAWLHDVEPASGEVLAKVTRVQWLHHEQLGAVSRLLVCPNCWEQRGAERRYLKVRAP
jgi:hypothetical protein